MKVGSLFTGIGGFDIAAERAGMTIEWQSENDKSASRVLAHHFNTPNYGDIHDITTSPAVDVLTGGFPCQDYSVAGHRKGLAGDRGALWWEYHRLIDELRPTWVVGENVPGLLYGKRIRDFEEILSSLTDLGYGVAWAILDAQYFGVAQRRRRVFIVGHSGGIPRPEVLALSEGLYGDSAPSQETGQVTASSLTSRLGTSGPDTADAQANWLTVVHATQDPATSMVAFAQNQRDEIRDLNNKAGALLAAEPGMKQQTYVSTPAVRRLTPLECERLQGFPDNWTNTPGNSDTQRYRQLGNAVAVPVAQWIMERIAA